MACGCDDKCELPKALQINNPGEATLFHRVEIPASQGDDETYPPKNGLYRNVLLVYLANNHAYLYSSDGIPTRVDGDSAAGVPKGGLTGQVLMKKTNEDYDTKWETQTSANDAKLTLTRNNTEIGDFTANASVDKTIDIEVPTKTSDLENDGATGESTYAEATDIADIWEEIEEIEAASDVTDVVGTYAELEAYDTSKLKDNDIIKVLEDETHDDQITYYRWDTDTETFTLIGAIGPYYTKSEANNTFQGKLTAGSNITIDANNEISATDTTYTAGEGININGNTIAAKVRRVYNYYTSRPASANLTATGNGGMFTFQATSSMTTGKPKNDSHILQLEWDNNSGFDSQIALSSWDSAHWMGYRTQSNGTWGNWVYLLNDEAGSVKTANIDALAVTTAKIADGAVTAAKIAPGVIPTVNDATLTIQKNGTTVETFTANSSTNKTANIIVPTKTSDLANDGEDGTSTYVEEDELQPSYIEGEGTSITFTSTQGAQFKDIELKGDTKQGATLPSGYTQVEYIQNTTDAYFSFPFALTGADTVTMDIQLTGAGSSGWATLWSARTNSQTNTNTSFVDCTGGAQVRGDYANNQSSTTVSGATSRHVYQQAQGNYFIDGVQKITRSRTNFNTPATTTVLASNENGGNIGNQGYGKIYSFTIVREYDFIHNFVPAVRNADSRAGLYDTVADKFYVNVGTGQFTAGNPTPTPDVPQTVHTVTGEQTISIIGNNLFEVTPSMLIVQGTYVSGANTNQFKVTATNTDLYINQILAAGSTWSKANQGNLIPCDYGETLYFTSGNTSFTKNLVTEYNEDKVSLGYYGLGAASGSFSPRFASCKYVSVRFGYEPAAVGTTYTLAPMVSRTSITEYEPYTNQEFKINLGKNIVDLSMINVEYGIYTETGALGSQSGRAAIYKVPVKPNTSYIATCAAGYQIGYGTTTYGANGVYIGSSGSGWVTTKTYTTNANTYFISFVIKNDAGTSLAGISPDTFKVQMEEGSTATTYTPHVELCKIGNYQDYIYQSGDNWYIHKVTDKVIDNGTKDYAARTNTSATYSKFYTSTDDLLSYPILDPIALVSDHFLPNLGANYTDYSGSAACGNATSGYKKRLWYSVPNSIATTTNAIKTWLQSNPVTTYYVMETAMDVQITGSIADQLNALAGATGYSGTTAITATVPSPDLPAILSLSTALPSALPLATTTSVGMVSVGDGLEADTNGRLSLNNGLVLVKTLAMSDIVSHSGTISSIDGQVYMTKDGKIGVLNIGQIRFDSAANTNLEIVLSTGLPFARSESVTAGGGIMWNYSATISTLSLGRWSVTATNTNGNITINGFNNATSTNLRFFGTGSIILKLD